MKICQKRIFLCLGSIDGGNAHAERKTGSTGIATGLHQAAELCPTGEGLNALAQIVIRRAVPGDPARLGGAQCPLHRICDASRHGDGDDVPLFLPY